ncbi:MAG TPA: phosphotransferase family protein [Acidimicrobiales bacterium]|nr:phosphotransferase family protein [Acidimicrobiales bacterium]
MALTVQRDLDQLVAGLTRWLGRDGEPVVVEAVDRPTEGWSSETVLVRAHVGDRSTAWAFRFPPLGPGIFPTYDLGLQARAQAVAAAAGVPAPVPAAVVDGHWVGDPFLAMPLVDGHVPGEMAGFDPWVQGLSAERRTVLHEGVADVLADLHRLGPVDGLPHRGLSAELAWWEEYLAWSAAPGSAVPVLQEALASCRDRRPAAEPPPAVLWGDVRLGNVVFDDDGAVAALLDWEMATVGAPEHDLGWWWALEAMQDELVGGRDRGFPPLDELRSRYEARAGRPLVDLAWYEVFALVRSAAILTRIGLLQQRAGVPTRMPVDDNPVLDHLARRAAEL